MSTCEHYLPLTLLDFTADSLVVASLESDHGRRRVNFDDTLAHSHSNQHDDLLLEEEEEEEEEELSAVTFTAQHARTRPDGTNDAIDDAETGV